MMGPAARAPVLMSLSPLPTPALLGSLSAGEPEAEQLQHGEHRVGWESGSGQREVQRGKRGCRGWWLLLTEGRSLLGSGCCPQGRHS